MQSRRVGFGTAARVLRTINMNYGKRSRTGPKGIVRGIARSHICTKAHAGYGSRRRPRRAEYMYVSACIFVSVVAQVSLSVSLKADRFKSESRASVVITRIGGTSLKDWFRR